MNETEAFLKLAEELPGIMFDTAALDAKSMSDDFPPPEQFESLDLEPSIKQALFAGNAKRFWGI